MAAQPVPLQVAVEEAAALAGVRVAVHISPQLAKVLVHRRELSGDAQGGVHAWSALMRRTSIHSVQVVAERVGPELALEYAVGCAGGRRSGERQTVAGEPYARAERP